MIYLSMQISINGIIFFNKNNGYYQFVIGHSNYDALIFALAVNSFVSPFGA